MGGKFDFNFSFLQIKFFLPIDWAGALCWEWIWLLIEIRVLLKIQTFFGCKSFGQQKSFIC